MKPLCVGIIGAGARAIAFCSYIKHNPSKMQLKAIADMNVEKAQFLIKHFDLASDVCSEYKDLLNMPDIEAVIIATPDYLHVEPTVSVLNAGKQIYLEKPLATTLQDCDTIIQAARKSSAKCYLGFNMRHSPVHVKIYELVHSDKMLGKITTIEANEWYYGGKSYFRRWNRLRKYGGGLWLTKACHDFDLITWLAGGMPVKMYATSSLSHYKPIPGAGPRCRDCQLKSTCPDYYDIQKPLSNVFEETWRQLQLKMPQEGQMAPDICLFNSDKDTFDNGIAVIEYDNDVRATYAVNVLAARTTRQIRVIGTEGMIEGDMETGLITFTERHTGKTTRFDLIEEIRGSHGGADLKILDDFVKMCREGAEPKSNLFDGRLAVQMSLAATQSSDSGSAVTLPL